jgi:hypothetical protein
MPGHCLGSRIECGRGLLDGTRPNASVTSRVQRPLETGGCRVEGPDGAPIARLGQKQTFAVQQGMSDLTPKADICGAAGHVRLVPKADMRETILTSTLDDDYAASVLRTPSALIARCSINWGSRSPVATTLTIALAISSVMGRRDWLCRD